MSTTFDEFVTRYTDGSIADDATWRAYDFEAMVIPAIDGVSGLDAAYGYYPGHNPERVTFEGLAAKYATMFDTAMTAARIEPLLALWWVWLMVTSGGVRPLIPRQGQTHVPRTATKSRQGARDRVRQPVAA